MSRLLVVDDAAGTQKLFTEWFSQPPFRLGFAATARAATKDFTEQGPDVVLVNGRFAGDSGLELLHELRAADARVPIIFMTTAEAASTGIEAILCGALDHLVKPLRKVRVQAVVDRALRVRRLLTHPVGSCHTVHKGRKDRPVLIGASEAMQEVYRGVGRVAPKNIPVLIQGETGTGKELVARAIYQHSRRSSGVFLAVNCAAIPEALLESELFGHEKGAFTGADRRRIGKFEQCSAGTLFLDEIGDMPLSLQSKLLRVLQEGELQRVGGDDLIPVDVRVIAATHRDLLRAVEAGQFRADLYYRLNAFSISLPPLRERRDDLPMLVEYLLSRLALELEEPRREIDPEAMAALMRYPWPGNVRELQNVLSQLLERVAHTREANVYALALELLERTLIPLVLRHTLGNQTAAADLLGITRGSLRSKIRVLGIDIDHASRTGAACPEPAAGAPE
jgi:two-component system nitrogen regulation response regulator GlnG